MQLTLGDKCKIIKGLAEGHRMVIEWKYEFNESSDWTEFLPNEILCIDDFIYELKSLERREFEWVKVEESDFQ